MLTPSIGLCSIPFTILGAGILHASKTVGAISMAWQNWLRISFFDLMPFGHRTTTPFRVPPKSDATCLVHANGALVATAQGTAKCGKVEGEPHSPNFL